MRWVVACVLLVVLLSAVLSVVHCCFVSIEDGGAVEVVLSRSGVVVDVDALLKFVASRGRFVVVSERPLYAAYAVDVGNCSLIVVLREVVPCKYAGTATVCDEMGGMGEKGTLLFRVQIPYNCSGDICTRACNVEDSVVVEVFIKELKALVASGAVSGLTDEDIDAIASLARVGAAGFGCIAWYGGKWQRTPVMRCGAEFSVEYSKLLSEMKGSVPEPGTGQGNEAVKPSAAHQMIEALNNPYIALAVSLAVATVVASVAYVAAKRFIL